MKTAIEETEASTEETTDEAGAESEATAQE